MRFLQVPSLLLPFVFIHILAGHPLYNVPVRSRKHHKQIHHDRSHNLTKRGAPEAKTGPMTLVDKYAGESLFE